VHGRFLDILDIFANYILVQMTILSSSIIKQGAFFVCIFYFRVSHQLEGTQLHVADADWRERCNEH